MHEGAAQTEARDGATLPPVRKPQVVSPGGTASLGLELQPRGLFEGGDCLLAVGAVVERPPRVTQQLLHLGYTPKRDGGLLRGHLEGGFVVND